MMRKPMALLTMLTVLPLILGTVGCGGDEEAFIDWANLANPILADDEIPLKDQCVVYKDGTFYIFASGASYRTQDFKTYEGPFEGFGSPDVTRLNETQYIMVYQTRDLENTGPSENVDPNSEENKYQRLYYRTSMDLENWSEGQDLFPELRPDRNIDGALARQGDYYYLGFKTGVLIQQFNVARSLGPEISGNWIGPKKAYAGEKTYVGGWLETYVGGWAENYQFIKIYDKWRMIATARHPDRPFATDYMSSHEPFIYELEGSGQDLDEWTNWINKTQLIVPKEDWNTLMHANSGYLCDWREYDGYFYLFYAGTDQETEDGRGHGRIGVVRSRDLENWKLPGEMD